MATFVGIFIWLKLKIHDYGASASECAKKPAAGGPVEVGEEVGSGLKSALLYPAEKDLPTLGADLLAATASAPWISSSAKASSP